MWVYSYQFAYRQVSGLAVGSTVHVVDTNTNQTVQTLISSGSNAWRWALMAEGVSDRAPCGAPDSVLAADQRSLVFGQSAVFSGLTASLGTDMRLGLLRAFSEVNAAER